MEIFRILMHQVFTKGKPYISLQKRKGGVKKRKGKERKQAEDAGKSFARIQGGVVKKMQKYIIF
jgi:hypothetical protein